MELEDVFFLSYQPNIPVSRGGIGPIARHGMISIINDDGSLYLDAFAFPGNSGSPVFVRPAPIRFGSDGAVIGDDPTGCKFIGIVGDYLPYQEIAISNQTGRARVIFEENAGLAHVWPVQTIEALFKNPGFINQHKEIKKAASIK